MDKDFLAGDSETILRIFEEIQRIAPELPDDIGFTFEPGELLTGVLRRLQQLPDAAGAAAVAAAMNPSPPV